MNPKRKQLTLFIILSITLMQSAHGIQVTATGGGNGERGSVGINIEAAKDTVVGSQITINGAYVTPTMALTGSVPSFGETHSFTDKSGKSVTVSANVINAPSGITYRSQILPTGADSTKTYPTVSAEQWLTVLKADSIVCTATSTYGTTRSAKVGLEEYKSTLAGDYVTLTGYYGKALTTDTSVLATQTATSGSANSINIYGSAKDSGESYSVNTPLKGISGGKATFTGLSETSSAGTTDQVVQKEHMHGTFTSTATYTSTTGAPKTKTRTSDYGPDYYLTMVAQKYASGPSTWGTLGYYVNPTTSANKIQGAVNAAQWGDTINVAAGTYKENVKIDKSMTINGAGSTKTFVDGNKVSTVFRVGLFNQNAVVALSGMTIQNGKYDSGGGIFNNGGLTVTGSTISGNEVDDYGGGIWNTGKLKVTGSTISGNIATSGGAIYNYKGNLIVTGSTISGNKVDYYGGGICNDGTATVTGSTISKNIATTTAESSSTEGDGAAIFNMGNLMVTGSTISGNTANSYGGGIYNHYGTMLVQNNVVSGNKATYSGGGILNLGGTVTATGNSITGNTALKLGGGVYNAGGKLIMTASTLSGNTASSGGGGVFNSGELTVTGNTISGNKVNLYGGGILNNGKLTVASSTISKNTATSGGGILNNGGTATITGGTISGNTAGWDGGGIFNSGSLLVCGTSKITNNIANGFGGGIYSGKSSITLDGTGVAINSNKAHQLTSELNWYKGWGIYTETSTTLKTTGGFNPAIQVTGNVHI